MKKFILMFFVAVSCSVFNMQDVLPQDCGRLKTKVADVKARLALLGRHPLTLQWIGWGRQSGTVNIYEKSGVLFVSGKQEDKKTGDYLVISGTVAEIKKSEFTFCGTITTRVSYLNSGEVCSKTGIFIFAVKGSRKFWRMQEMQNPCETDNVVDYVDIYFR